MTIYTTRTDAIRSEIIDPIEASGIVTNAFAAYDLDQIANAIIAFEDAYDADTNTHQLNQQGYYCTCRPDEFWEIIARFELEG